MPAQPSTLTRRRFTLTAAAALAATRLPAQQPARTSVAAMERDAILAAATLALAAKPTQDLAAISPAVAALAAAFVLTKDEMYARAAQPHLAALGPPIASLAQPPTVLELLPAAELARASSFLVDALDLTAANVWFAGLSTWLTTAHEPVIARDTKDHRASAWLLLAAALSRSQRNEVLLDQCRARFRKPTLRNQIDELGHFPQEMATPTPFRNTLFNFDLLFGACQLLDSPFDPLWDYELPDGPGPRAVAAWLYPVLKDPRTWPGVADPEHFRDVPLRRPALLFAGRAYSRPEYVELFTSLPTVPYGPSALPPALAATFPIRQPLLWTSRAAHGL